jgi:hypothetical protein
VGLFIASDYGEAAVVAAVIALVAAILYTEFSFERG